MLAGNSIFFCPLSLICTSNLPFLRPIPLICYSQPRLPVWGTA
jgi:hypothetical protein